MHVSRGMPWGVHVSHDLNYTVSEVFDSNYTLFDFWGKLTKTTISLFPHHFTTQGVQHRRLRLVQKSPRPDATVFTHR